MPMSTLRTQRSSGRRHRTSESGAAIVLATVFLVVLLAAASLSFDISNMIAVQVHARLSQAARALPLFFAPVLGATSFDTVRTAMSVIGATSKQNPTAPVAVNRDVFNGKAKGFLPPDDLYLSTKNLTDMAWTGFFGPTNASAVKSFETDPSTIPQLKVGDVINITSSNQTADYHAMKADYPPGTNILVPVCIFDAGIARGTVVGFATLRVDFVQDTSDPKYIDTTVVPKKTGSTDPNTIAECFGTDCRSFLVN